MRYRRNTNLLPVTPAELRLAERVPFHNLKTADLLLYDETVSNFFFEFEPQEDIERFLQHAHFAGVAGGRFIACREDLFGVAARAESRTAQPLHVNVGTELPLPLRFVPIPNALVAACRDDEFRGMVTICRCGIAGCMSQYAWVRESVCLALFTIKGACLTEVLWCPFRFEYHATSEQT